MKHPGTKENVEGSRPAKIDVQRLIDSVQQEVEHYKREKDILLALSNDLTKVRDKNDLITLFKKGIKGLFYITHTIVTLIDYKDETYTPFLLDNDGSPIRSHGRYKEMAA